MQAANAPSLAASIYIAGFNLENIVGAIVGGSVNSIGLGCSAVAIAEDLLAIMGLGGHGYGRYRKGREVPLDVNASRLVLRIEIIRSDPTILTLIGIFSPYSPQREVTGLRDEWSP